LLPSESPSVALGNIAEGGFVVVAV
jgi:hypothetical protein